MTIKGFADKYNIPYHIAYEASYNVQPIGTWERDKDYPEDDLFNETKKLISKRIEKHRKLLNQALRSEVNLNKGRWGYEMPKMRRKGADV